MTLLDRRLFSKSLGALCITALICTAVPIPQAAAQVTETVAKKRMIAAANPHAAKAGLDLTQLMLLLVAYLATWISPKPFAHAIFRRPTCFSSTPPIAARFTSSE